MEDLFAFRQRLAAALAGIEPEVLAFHEDEFWMIRAPYEFLEYFAEKHRLFNMALSLPLARGLHDGVYRKLPVIRSGEAHRPPYVIHCLLVCRMLADMWLPISHDEQDILLAAALCHDMIEDMSFPKGGQELTDLYGLDRRVYETVLLVSKRKDFTAEEEQTHFRSIEENKLALLIKLSDRGHNVTDLYNMSEKKIQEYIAETRSFILPMCRYGREQYPELEDALEIMQDQLICLTKTVEMQALRHAGRREELRQTLERLREENEALHEQCQALRRRGRL